MANRDPVGIGLDTMSLDPGNSADFAVHVEFLTSGRYGIESMANLDRIPPRGALAFVGPVPWEDGVRFTVPGHRGVVKPAGRWVQPGTALGSICCARYCDTPTRSTASN